MLKSKHTYVCYVGSDNETKELNLDKIIEIAMRYYDGVTIQDGLNGLWKGELEKTASVMMISDKKTLNKFIEDIKIELKQDAVAYHKINKLNIK